MVFWSRQRPCRISSAPFGLEKNMQKNCKVGGTKMGVYLSPAGISNCRFVIWQWGPPPGRPPRVASCGCKVWWTCSLDYHSKLKQVLEPFPTIPFSEDYYAFFESGTRIWKHPLILGTLVGVGMASWQACGAKREGG